MLFIFLCALLGFGVSLGLTIHARKKHPEKYDDCDEPHLGVIMMTFTGALAGFIIVMSMPNIPTTWVETNRSELVSSRASDTQSGSFFLGSGSFDSELRYVYYVRARDGGIYPVQLNAISNNVRVYEDTTSNAHVTTYTRRAVPHQNSLWRFAPIARDEGETFYAFHVPAGTVRRNITFN